MEKVFEEGKHSFKIIEGKPYLLGGKCSKCQEYSFPKRDVCYECFSAEVNEVKLSGKGTIHAAAVVKIPPWGFEGPYAVSYVDLEEGPRIFTQLTTCNEAEIVPGVQVELVSGKYRVDEDGNDIVGYKFQPTESEMSTKS